MKYILLISLLISLISCSVQTLPDDTLSNIIENDVPRIIIKINFKKVKWKYDSCQYDYHIQCGYVYDKWIETINPNNICQFSCYEVPVGLSKKYVYPTINECLNTKP